jgi:hypothetical protein
MAFDAAGNLYVTDSPTGDTATATSLADGGWQRGRAFCETSRLLSTGSGARQATRAVVFDRRCRRSHYTK